jgi:hypothetical protein
MWAREEENNAVIELGIGKFIWHLLKETNTKVLSV